MMVYTTNALRRNIVISTSPRRQEANKHVSTTSFRRRSNVMKLANSIAISSFHVAGNHGGAATLKGCYCDVVC